MTSPPAINLFLARQWQSLALGSLWLGFVIYAIFLSPPSAPDTLETIGQLSTGQWGDLNAAVVVLFNLMGLWPVVYAALALSDGRDQSIPAWPFVLGSFALGAFALMPYLALRQSTHHLPQRPDDSPLLRGLNHRLVGLGVAISMVLLLTYGVTSGHGYATLQNFYDQFVSSQFIHVMGLDFCMLSLLTPRLMWDDMARRQVAPFWRGLSWLPLLGPALYLALRPAAPCSPTPKP
ncbi:DUF2834 domain-containing protein [Leptothoe kymatousa]|uniref:DUF2834 domain-containing protein n=1 Tax=Leptothoe kymatousa TAU-MAC 1615 TaxID=2364775 RepID=A0ABS5Y3X5_9CYAN|nr:DUF2834 domain-containing protein [Leptothoe kymatousa]MBT9312522.1 DUF2834 domain-containing protein [Leptothoe kymatousa TAU-MAC 1615]